ncbi:MAG: DUF262 domain-containing protein [Betaproteobacteria bacterium]|nr:DUF262 domain-containing protein [Betaproteobacteria bacterium]
MKSFLSSYNGLFMHHSPDAPTVEKIEIPLIQRDYAQGRQGGVVERIRDNFLNVLQRAVSHGEHVTLDFVYGEVKEGTLHPLDGQQRLTTLFLLHWYLAYRADRLDQEQGWKQFSYATRASARLFCERLVERQPPAGTERLSSWIEDQPWYLYTWRHDPTIQSMLVMLDAMHQRFRNDDCLTAWERLVDSKSPAISFHLLPMEEMGLSDDLYIKMNSRGKPLSPFENFKARFEQTLEESCPDRVKELALKVDGAWSDMLWPFHGNDFIVDDEFLHYFHFVTEICEWRRGRLAVGEIAPLAERVYGSTNPKAAEHLDFLFQAFDTWVEADTAAVFGGLFVAAPASSELSDPTKTVLYGQEGSRLEINLFSACCRSYGEMRGKSRVFSLAHTLLLYAVILHRLHETPEFARRLRVLRNLVEASSNELRLERMPALVADVERIVVGGALEGVTSFNQTQVADERLKAEWLATNQQLAGALFQLEDHPILRGCLAAFDLDATSFAQRASAFHQLFSDPGCWLSLTGALLATGDYSRQVTTRIFQLGSSSNLVPWRRLLTNVERSDLKLTREVLGRLLDEVANAGGDLHGCLSGMQERWLKTCEDNQTFDWRYYLVKYVAMREGGSGIYIGWNGALGYLVCMLDKIQMNSWYRDPYLQAIHRESGVKGAVDDPWFTGYETQPRWMRLVKTGIELRCVEAGIELKCTVASDAFTRICEKHGAQCIGDKTLLRIPQVERDGKSVDASDRVQLGAALLRDLVEAAL